MNTLEDAFINIGMDEDKYLQEDCHNDVNKKYIYKKKNKYN